MENRIEPTHHDFQGYQLSTHDRLIARVIVKRVCEFSNGLRMIASPYVREWEKKHFIKQMDREVKCLI